MIFLVENKDNILQRWSLPWIGRLQTTDYCVRMVIVLSSLDESLIQAYEHSRAPNFSILDPWLHYPYVYVAHCTKKYRWLSTGRVILDEFRWSSRRITDEVEY